MREIENDELDDLLGEVSDEELETGTSDNKNSVEQSDELDQYLGSTSSDEENKPDSSSKDLQSSSQDDEKKKLDEILGVDSNTVKSPVGKDLRKNSKISLSNSLKLSDSEHSIFLRAPKFIKFQPKPLYPNFDFQTEKQKFETAVSIIRWKNTLSGPKSNARLIKWDDGSYQIVVGDSVFDAKFTPVDNCYIFETKSGLEISKESETNEEVSCMECNGPIKTRITLQPPSLDSETHIRMSKNVMQKFKKEQKIVVEDYEKITENPEKALMELAKREEEQIRKERKLSEKAKAAAGGEPRRSLSYSRPTMSEGYLLGDQDYYENENVGAIKNSFRKSKKPENGRKRFGRDDESLGSRDSYSDDDEENEEDDGFIDNGEEDDYDEEEEDEENEIDDDEEEDEENEGGDEDKPVAKNSKSKKRELSKKKSKPEVPPMGDVSHAFENDDEEEEDQFIPQRKKVKKAALESDDEL